MVFILVSTILLRQERLVDSVDTFLVGRRRLLCSGRFLKLGWVTEVPAGIVLPISSMMVAVDEFLRIGIDLGTCLAIVNCTMSSFELDLLDYLIDLRGDNLRVLF